MKLTIKILTLVAIATFIAVPALAQAKECNDENKAAWYDTFLKNYKGEAPQQKIAYDAAKLYLTSCPEDPADKIAEFMKKKFVEPYEKLTAESTVKKQFEDAYKAKNYAEQIKLGKQIVAAEPENSAIYIIMGIAGLGDESLLGESSQSAKRAIELIETGKPFAPYETKDKALAVLNYEIGKANVKNSPADAIPYLLKAAKFESDLKKNPQLYLDLAGAYNDGPRAVLTKEYTAKIGPNQTETPESKLALANLNQVIDRQIDAMARAAALADAANKKAIMDELTEIYKYRNKTADGLNELVANVLSKPLPEVPTPLTSLPTPPPTSTSGASGAAGTSGSTPTGTTGSPKPAASPTPSNKKPR